MYFSQNGLNFLGLRIQIGFDFFGFNFAGLGVPPAFLNLSLALSLFAGLGVALSFCRAWGGLAWGGLAWLGGGCTYIF